MLMHGVCDRLKGMSMSNSYALKKITIRDFKSIANVELELGKVNMLIGENGAGKSNILEAIGVISAAVGGNTSYISLKERGVRLSAPEVFKLALKGRTRKPLFRLDADFAGGLRYHLTLSPARGDTGDKLRYWTEELTVGVQKIASRGAKKRMTIGEAISNIDEASSVITAAQALNKIDEDNLKRLAVLRDYAIFSPATHVLRNIATDESAKSPLGLYGGSLALALGNIFQNTANKVTLGRKIRKLFPWLASYGKAHPTENLVSHHIHPGKTVLSFTDKRMSNAFNKLFAYDVSEGILYVLFLFVLILHEKAPSFFALDNLDSALNPAMTTAMLLEATNLIKTMPDKQMIFTTHNPSMLNAIDLFDEDQRLFVVERDKDDGSTIVRRINPAGHMDREKWRELAKGRALSELWVSGAMGGLPDVRIPNL